MLRERDTSRVTEVISLNKSDTGVDPIRPWRATACSPVSNFYNIRFIIIL